MAWPLLAAAGIGAAGSLLGGLLSKGQPPPASPGIHTAGWTGDTLGGSRAPVSPTSINSYQGILPESKPTLEPLQKPPGRFKRGVNATNRFLGSNIGIESAKVAGGFLNDYRARRNTRNNRKDLQKLGLNPYEIAGSGAGGPISSQGNTLGSGSITQIDQQQEFTAAENEKSREVPRGQLKVAKGRLAIEDVLSTQQFRQMQANIDKIHLELRDMETAYKERWARLISGMSRENVIASVAMFNAGIPAKMILNVTGLETAAQKAAGQQLMRTLLKISARTTSGMIAIAELIRETLGIPQAEGVEPGAFQGKRNK